MTRRTMAELTQLSALKSHSLVIQLRLSSQARRFKHDYLGGGPDRGLVGNSADAESQYQIS